MGIAAAQIRLAGAEDVNALCRVGTASFRAAYAGTSSAEELHAHLEENFSAPVVTEEVDKPGVSYLLATVEEKVGALAKLCVSDIPAAIPSRNAIEIRQFYVAPEQQRMGLGGQLMDAALNYAALMSAEGVWLSVWDEADWAVKFYLGHGFTKVGTIDFPMGSTVYNDFLMWRPTA